MIKMSNCSCKTCQDKQCWEENDACAHTSNLLFLEGTICSGDVLQTIWPRGLSWDARKVIEELCLEAKELHYQDKRKRHRVKMKGKIIKR